MELKGAADGQALLHEIQWDTFQQHVLHVDLLRVDAKDRVKIEVDLLLRGEAPGEHEGGVVEHLVHHLEIETDPGHVPDHLHVSVNHLHLGGMLKIKDIIDLPEGAKVLGDADMVLVQCVEPTKPRKRKWPKALSLSSLVARPKRKVRKPRSNACLLAAVFVV